MNFLVTLLVLTAIVVIYITWLRPWLRAKSWAQGFFAAVEPIELALWKKSETILWARFLQVVGLVSTLAGVFGLIDWTLITPLVSEQYQPFMPLIPMTLNLIGTVTEKLRRDTTKPLEVVAAPEAVKAAIPEVAKLERANDAAVVAVKEAAAEGVSP